MCCVSAITGYGMLMYPKINDWSITVYAPFKKAIEAAKAVDVSTGQVDCSNLDLEKKEFLVQLEIKFCGPK